MICHKLFIILIAAGCAFAAGPSAWTAPASADELRLGHNAGFGTVLDLIAAEFARRVKAQLSQTMQVNEADLFAFLMRSFALYKEFARDVPGGKPIIKLLYDPASLIVATGKPVN